MKLSVGACAKRGALPLRAGGGGKANEPMELAALEHPKVVNSAYFSPRTGSKILTTCIDNRRAHSMLRAFPINLLGGHSSTSHVKAMH